MNKITKLGFLIPLFAWVVPAHGQDLSYSFVQLEAGSSEVDIGNTDVDGDFFAGSVSYELSDIFFVGAGFSSADYDFDIEQSSFQLGLGAHTPLSAVTDLYGGISFIDAEVEQSFAGSADDTGYGFDLGIRHLISSQFEVNGGLEYVDIFDDNSTGFSFGGRYYFIQNFSVGLAYSAGDDVSAFSLSGRFNF